MNKPLIESSTTNPDESMSWEHPRVQRYEETIPLKIPGYMLLYEMTERLLRAHLHLSQDSSKLLIVGAGGGQELVTLGNRHKDWTFTGIDPSRSMLEIARRRAAEAGVAHRVSLQEGTIEQLSTQPAFDAATCLLVLHFIHGESNKRKLLQDIADRLEPGAPLFLASINGNPSSAPFSIQMKAWKGHMLDNGISLQEWERFAASIGRESDPIPDYEVLELLEKAGFTQVTHYFGSYLIDAWYVVKSAGEDDERL
ncbi:class I SAM-dependent methyltransferase [Paenibacillus lentus]|uniref:Class I SAM-dependent methyltransferase n=1 Tax=Paenibacillus lentus TaxID=1338368 RepID=A0A3Q8SCY2_9BACL|nr:class I SAM-dependent methyltransferase [Paenibacillus lentus]AZK47880.1 class I SAM-dependent methyltransferase [Paenibacillus lentus]